MIALELALTCNRLLRIGNRAKSWTENSMRLNTATSVERREAKTTEDDIAAFIERTEDNLLLFRLALNDAPKFLPIRVLFLV